MNKERKKTSFTNPIKYISFVVLAFCMQAVYSQEEDVFFPKFGFGANTFFNYSSIDFKPSFNQTYYYGNGVGFVFNYISEEYKGGVAHKYTGKVHSGIQMELNYQQRGWKEDTDSTPDLYTHRINYLEIPFMSHITWGKRDVKFVVDFGPFVSFLQSSSNKTLTSDSTYIQTYFGRKPDSEFDYGFIFAPGLFVDTKAGVFTVQFRYNQGMKRVLDEFLVTETRTLRRSYSRGLQLAVGYHFPVTSRRTIVYSEKRPKKSDVNMKKKVKKATK